MQIEDQIRDLLHETTSIFEVVENNQAFIKQIIRAYELMRETFRFEGKILIFGNGGSAAQAQHFAAELVCQFEKKRRALPAIALNTDSSILTAQSNDSGFEYIFSRQIEALGRRGDLAIGLTTSDADINRRHSYNILNAFLTAKNLKLHSMGLFSQRTQSLLKFVDAPVIVPSDSTALTQEIHQRIIHILCSLIEAWL